MCDADAAFISPAFMRKIENALLKFLNNEDIKDGLELNLELTQMFIETEISKASSNAKLRALSRRRMIRAGILCAL